MSIYYTCKCVYITPLLVFTSAHRHKKIKFLSDVAAHIKQYTHYLAKNSIFALKIQHKAVYIAFHFAI